jgi:hypothetical protein
MDLRVRCDRRPDAQKGETDPRKLYYDSNVYSGMLEWSPVNQQAETFAGNEPRPVVDDVLLTKLRPGQVRLFFGSALMYRWWTCIVSHEREQEQITRNGLQSVSYLQQNLNELTGSNRILPTPTPHHHPLTHPTRASRKVPRLFPTRSNLYRKRPQWRSAMHSQEPKEGHSIARSAASPRIPGFGSVDEDT